MHEPRDLRINLEHRTGHFFDLLVPFFAEALYDRQEGNRDCLVVGQLADHSVFGHQHFVDRRTHGTRVDPLFTLLASLHFEFEPPARHGLAFEFRLLCTDRLDRQVLNPLDRQIGAARV